MTNVEGNTAFASRREAASGAAVHQRVAVAFRCRDNRGIYDLFGATTPTAGLHIADDTETRMLPTVCAHFGIIQAIAFVNMART